MNFKKIKLGLAGMILSGFLSNPLSAQYKETDFERVYPLVNNLSQPIRIEKQKKDWVYHGLEASLIGLNVADVILTIKGLEKGAIEFNPLIKPFADNPYALAAIKTGGIGLALYLNRKIRKYDTKYAKGFLIVSNLFYGFVVSHNFKVVRKL